MSGLSEASTPAQEAGPPSIDQQLPQHAQELANDLHQPPLGAGPSSAALAAADSGRKPKAPSVRRACISCHAGKTRCSEVLPCQSCIKRGLSASCTYPDPDADHPNQNQPPQVPPFAAAIAYPPPMQGLPPPQYYDYNNTFPANPSPSTSSFRPSKRPRPLTEEETAAIRNFTRGDFFVGNSAPVRIDPRLPVRLTLGEGDVVHFTIGEIIVG